MRIGRRSASRGLAPEIDLTGPPADPGISRLHAVLIAVPDGHWAVLDPGSANGTLVNGAEIAIGEQVPLHDGDRINLGAWTAITVHRDDHLHDYRVGDEEGRDRKSARIRKNIAYRTRYWASANIGDHP